VADENEEQEQRRRSEREISEHDRVMARNAAHASRDTLHDASAGQQPGAYTTEQARDRAAHTPSLLETRDAPRSRQEEERMLDELFKETFPSDEARREFEREGLPKVPPSDWVEFEIWRDLMEIDGVRKPDAGKERSDMTPEQQASIDKVINRGDIGDKAIIGPATEVSGKPVPNDPTPVEKANDIGKDLHERGVTMEK
jgi:hypothetical protein